MYNLKRTFLAKSKEVDYEGDPSIGRTGNEVGAAHLRCVDLHPVYAAIRQASQQPGSG
jgi:hypothetical protein